ncbi:helicase SNF [Paenibacillus sp. BIHB 4019]|uniref:Helicase SNF n=1 Tax=Paenibacillus sp. BIHB 4019 TaxID=1870819 RepID=A0A1B2DKR0_9BACL|nr:DEAD/DEAH box helicase [Paenibacillus sp. BIHB 4019]ANY68271.1 helicase SNF [Paenibacillus sp. BIHB 4019]
MRASIGTGILTMDACWMKAESGEYRIALFASDQQESAIRLRSVLFAWHKASWYGTEVEDAQHGDRKALLLSPLLAVDYLSQPKHARLLQVEWTERAQRLRELASLIREALLQGWFMPDWSGWSEEQRAWKLNVPETKAGGEANTLWERLIQEAGHAGDVDVQRWLSLAVEEVLQQPDSLAADAWQKVGTAAGGEIVVLRKAAEEEDWLIALGLRKDSLPFKVALQLVEPGEQPEWTLRPALQSRSGGAWLPLVRGAAGAWALAADSEPDSSPSWKAGTEGLVPAEAEASLPEEWLPLLPAKLAKEEAKWVSALPGWQDPAAAGQIKLRLSDNEAWSFMESASLTLLDAGCPVLLPSWWEAVRSRKLRLKAKVKSSVGSDAQPMFGLDQIVQFDWKMALGNVDLSEAEFMRLAEENRRLMKIGGEWVHLDPQDVAQIRSWVSKMGKKSGLSFRDIMEMHLMGGAVLEEEEEQVHDLRAEVELNEHLSRWLEQLQHTSEIPLIDKPEGFLGELRPYQLQGVSWLLFLRRFGFGGCLADDMGLGKTIQFMAYLVYVKEQREQQHELGASLALAHAPSLLVCPTSVIGNWEKELEKFAPQLKVHLHYGPKREKGEAFEEAVRDMDLVITSYSLAQLDEEDLGEVSWDALCLDEAQNIKNIYTKQSAAIRKLPARHRVALTGTPMENRLTELWSIYDFINPGYLGGVNEFRKEVVAPIERTRDEKMIAGLQRWVKPFMLRRIKKDPAIQLSLPEKFEGKTYISLTAEQGAMYENIVSDLLEKLDTLGAMQRRGLILASLTRLKQLCNHPGLMEGDNGGAKQWEEDRSNKVARLMDMVEEVAAEGERCLIFTQFVEMGHQLKKLLEERLGTSVPYLHGGVPKIKRDEMIQGFQNPEQPCSAFVLSLKAGGTGLNLTAANHVFHFDRWWNPAVENQATDRAFRIGQTREVQVHKFITLGTLEEKIDEMIERKQSLNDQVVGQSEQWITELSTDELKELFELRKNWLKG